MGKIPNFDTLESTEQADFLALCYSYSDEGYPRSSFTSQEIVLGFSNLRIAHGLDIPNYLTENSDIGKAEKKKFLKSNGGFQITRTYEKELRMKIEEIPFINYSINSDSFDWKPSDIPFLNSDIKKMLNFSQNFTFCCII